MLDPGYLISISTSLSLSLSLPNIEGRRVSSSVRARTPPQSASSPSIHGDQRPLPPRPRPAPRSTVPSASPFPSPTTTSLPPTPNAAEPLSPLTRPSRAAAVPRRSPSRTPTSPPPAFTSPTEASPTASRARPWTGRKTVVHWGTAWEVLPAAAGTASASVGGGRDDGPLKTKGRGFREDPNSFSAPRDSRLVGISRAGFDALASDGGPGPVRSIEGWIVLVTGIHEEAQEDDLHNIFGNFGQVKNLHLNLDRRTGFVKGYALIEYENFEEAQAAIKASDGTELLTQIISVDWAFSNGPVKRRNTRKRFSRIGANSTPSSPPPTTPPTNGKRGNSKKPPTDGTSSPSSSGAGDVLRLMDALRVEPDEDVYISLLRDSANAAEVAAVHAHIAGKRAAFGLSLPLANRLLLAYASCGDRAAARKVFDEMPVKNGITWATMVSTYSDGCFHSEAIWLFTCMCHEARDLGGDCYDHAIVPVLRSCARVSEPRLGEQVHALVIKKNGVRGDIGSSLLQLYCESSLHSRARRVLDMMRCSCEEPVPEAAWTSFITACHRDGLLDEAIDVFRDMVSFGVARSSFSLSSILAVCAESENQGCHGQQAHADAIKHGVNTNQFVMSGLVHMYAKQGQLANAARVFDTVGSQRDGVCWNTMALAYVRSGWYREATRVMYRMKAAGVKPSELTINEVRLAYSR